MIVALEQGIYIPSQYLKAGMYVTIENPNPSYDSSHFILTDELDIVTVWLWSGKHVWKCITYAEDPVGYRWKRIDI